MTTARFSLKSIFATMTLAAVGCAALANPTELWASVAFSGTLAILALSVLVAIVRRSVGAVGFFVFGAGYLMLIHWPDAQTTITPHLITTHAIEFSQDLWHPQTGWIAEVPGGVPFVLSFGYFQRIGHSLFALMFAIVGWVVARWLGRGEAHSDG